MLPYLAIATTWKSIEAMAQTTKTKTTVYNVKDNLYKYKRNYVKTSFGTPFKDEGFVQMGTSNLSLTSSVTTYSDTNRNWKELIRNHQSATTRLEGTKRQFRSKPIGSLYANWTCTGLVGFEGYKCSQSAEGWLLGPQTPGTTPIYGYSIADIDPDALLQAKYKLFQELKDKKNAFQGMTFLGELAETVHMLRKPLSGVRKGLGDYLDTVKKRARKSSVPSMNKMIADTWLEKSYGWAPMLADIGNAGEALSRQLDRYESLYQRFSVLVETDRWDPTWTTYNSSAPYLNLDGWFTYWEVRHGRRSSVKYYGQVYTAAMNTKKALRENWGFTLNDFVPTMWELIPYSFLVDYFSNVGDILNAASTYTGDVAWIAIGEKVTATSQSRLKSYTFTPPSPAKSGTLKYKLLIPNLLETEYQTLFRSNTSIPTVNPFSDFRLKVPGAGSAKWLNIAALLTSAKSTQKVLKSLVR